MFPDGPEQFHSPGAPPALPRLFFATCPANWANSFWGGHNPARHRDQAQEPFCSAIPGHWTLWAPWRPGDASQNTVPSLLLQPLHFLLADAAARAPEPHVLIPRAFGEAVVLCPLPLHRTPTHRPSSHAHPNPAHTHTHHPCPHLSPHPCPSLLHPLGWRLGSWRGSWLLTLRVVLESSGLGTWYHICTNIWLLPRSPENRRGWRSTMRGEDAPKPAKPMVSQSQPCHWHTVGHQLHS